MAETLGVQSPLAQNSPRAERANPPAIVSNDDAKSSSAVQSELDPAEECKIAKVMIVDDEAFNIKVVQTHLKLAGYSNFITATDSTQVMEMVLREGKNREIRRVLARVGHKVLRLTRVAVGPVRLGSLSKGEVRRLTHEEIKSLRREGSVGGG